MNDVASWIWVLIPLAAIGIAPFKMWLRIKEKQIVAQSDLAAEKSAQYAPHMERIEARLRVLEQIVTDSGAQTAAQIEALRDQATAFPSKDKASMNPFEFVLAIIVITDVRLQLLQAPMGIPSGRWADAAVEPENAPRLCGCATRSPSSRNGSRCSSGSRSRKRTAWPRKSSRSATARRLGRAGMAGLPPLTDILEEYQLVDAEDRYRLLIDLGRQLEPMPDALKTDATKVRGCSASVWVYPTAKTVACTSSPTATPRSPRASSRWCVGGSGQARRGSRASWTSHEALAPFELGQASQRQPHPGRAQHDRPGEGDRRALRGGGMTSTDRLESCPSRCASSIDVVENDSIRSSGTNTIVDVWVDGRVALDLHYPGSDRRLPWLR